MLCTPPSALARNTEPRRARPRSAREIDAEVVNSIEYGSTDAQALADAWATNIREGDVLARYGGEEFLLVLPATSLEAAQVVIGRLLGVGPGVEVGAAVRRLREAQVRGEVSTRAEAEALLLGRGVRSDCRPDPSDAD